MFFFAKRKKVILDKEDTEDLEGDSKFQVLQEILIATTDYE